MTNRPAIDLNTRVTLRIPEAAMALGVSESSIRRAMPGLSDAGIAFRLNGTVLITVAGLRRWAEERAEAERQEAQAAAETLLECMS